MIQRKIFRFGVLAMIFLMPLCGMAQKGEKIQTVVIDAGHGGPDAGALGKKTTEKKLNLAVALKLGDYINENMPDVKVVYTRTTDKFVELSERASIANRHHADVFISIHCNSAENNTTANGAEVFVMGESKNEANLRVAMTENSAILLEENTDAYDNFDPNSTEAYILFSLSQSEYQKQSLKLADKVQRQLVDKAGRTDRGVQQAGFLVLWKTSMPSILVELGFISNPQEEKYLLSDQGQTQLALALYRAFEEYKNEYDAENQKVVEEPQAPIVASNKPAEAEKKPSETEKKPAEAAPKKTLTNKSNGRIYFSIQISSGKTKLPTNDWAFRKVKNVEVQEVQGGYYRYTAGRFLTKEDAAAHLTEVQAAGFADAFVVAFMDGEHVSIQHAEQELQKMK